jgi:hypothetical protein
MSVQVEEFLGSAGNVKVVPRGGLSFLALQIRQPFHFLFGQL